MEKTQASMMSRLALSMISIFSIIRIFTRNEIIVHLFCHYHASVPAVNLVDVQQR